MVRPGSHDMAYVIAWRGMAWYMVWPGGHDMGKGMAWRNMVLPGNGIWYSLAGWLGIWYGLMGMA